MKKILSVIFCLFLFVTSVYGMRIVILYPAVSPIVKALSVPSNWIVGVTKTDNTFHNAVKVGSHLRPNIELIKALHPDLLIVGSKRAFPPELEKRIGIKVFRYDPRTLTEILERIKALGKVLNKEKQAEELINKLQKVLKKVRPLPRRVGVIYEVMSNPLRVSGAKDIVSDIIYHAGGRNLITIPKKHVAISPEEVLALNPDFYIYQVGPMNRNPVPPKKRPYFKDLKAVVIKVKEKDFARPGINAFYAVVKLNRTFWKYFKK
ncbi:MAG: ABC transporter substrate-binding protein [Thermodesulfobacteria bacterium]|nr:ABC transporter substrate-binding protein [Thermodesulfobacteriota bacterium]